MPALPTVGGSNNTWGTELNAFLNVAHNADGTLKSGGEARLSGSHASGATTLTLDGTRAISFAVGTYVIIDPFTTSAEIRRITATGSSSLTVAALTDTHASGTVVLSFVGGLVPWTLFGALPGSTAAASTNVTAFNRLTNQIYTLGNYYYGGIFVPPGIWYIDDELQMERDQILEGSSVMNAKITAHSTFSFPDVETAMLHPQRDGTPVTFATSGVSSRWTLRNVYFDGGNVTGSNGILSSPQQPDSWENIRVDNCKGYGAAISDVQQHVIKNFEAINCGISLRLRDCSFIWVDGFNSENADTHDCLMDLTAAGLGLHNIHFENFHIENLDLAGGSHFLIDTTSAASEISGLVWDLGWFSTDGTKIMFDFSNAAVIADYKFRDIRCYGTPTNVTAIHDASRSLTLNVRDQFDDHIHEYHARLASYSTAANIHGEHSFRVDGPDGASVRMGTPKGTGSQPTGGFFSSQVNSNERHARFYDGSTLAFEVATNGATTIGASGTPITKVIAGSTTWDPGSIADGAVASTTVAVTGAVTNMPCFATFTSLVANWLITAICTSSDVVTVTIQNKTGGPVDLANGTVRVCQMRF